MLKCFSCKLASHKTMSVFVGVMYRDYVDDGVLQLPPTVTKRVKAVSDEFEKSVQSKVSRQLECLLH